MPRSIAQLREIAQRSTLLAGLVDTLETNEQRLRSLLAQASMTNDEAAEFDGLTGANGERSLPLLRARVEQIADEVERNERAQAALATTGDAGPEAPEQRTDQHRTPARVTSEPTTYQRGGRTSYFRDLTTVSLNREGRAAALDRMHRNAQEVEVQLREQRALTTVDGAGGEFVPPLWMVNEYIELARAGRVTADRVRHETLPGGTDSINVPRIATGTAVAEQATQNTAVQNTDATTGSLTASVATLAGQQVVSVQLIEQSPINLDTILLNDLAADYATKLDVFVLNNNAAGKLGLLNVSSINAITYTDASPTVGELYPKVADAVQQVHTLRFLPPDAIVMHPRRWAWFLSALDTAGRPLVTPYDGMNTLAQTGGVIAQGYVGTLQGLPVYVDPSVPINLGAGTNEDRIIVARFADSILWEGNQRAEAFRETYANQLSVLLRFYNYVAFTGGRYPKSISVISGTGLVTPTF
jgi:HK97 family phage major capsid protein